MKYAVHLCLFAVVLIPAVLSAQIKAGELYPKPRRVADPSATIICAEGNCLEGSGVKVILEPSGSGIGRGKEWLTRMVHVLRGNFAEEGRQFTGKKYSVKIKYLRNSGSKGKYSPDMDIALNGSDPKLENYLVYEGGLTLAATKNGRLLTKKQGAGTDYTRSANKYGYIQSYRGLYQNDTIQCAVILFRNNNLLAFEGMVHYAGEELIYGDLLFKDNSLYRGSFFNKKFNGPGQLISPDGTVQEGFWDDGILISREKVALLSPSIESFQRLQTTPATLRIGKYTYPGQFTGTLKNGLPEGNGFFFTPSHTLFYGSFSNGIPQGKGVALISSPSRRSDQSIAYFNLFHYSGSFSDGWLTQGVIKTSSVNDEDGKYLDVITSRTGSFSNHWLQGCGILKETTTANIATKTQALFKDDKPAGWYKKNNDVLYAGSFKQPVLAYPDAMSFANANYTDSSTSCTMVNFLDAVRYYTTVLDNQRNERQAALLKKEQEEALAKNKETLCKRNMPLVGYRFEATNRSGAYEILSYDCEKGRFTAFYFPAERELKSQYQAYYNNSVAERVTLSGTMDFTNTFQYRKTGTHSHMHASICNTCKGTGKINTGRYSEQDPNVVVVGNTLYYNQDAILITNYTTCSSCKGQKVR